MARPRVRTASLTSFEVQELRDLFGTIANAYRKIPVLTRHMFADIARGYPAREADIRTFRRFVQDWKRRPVR